MWSRDIDSISEKPPNSSLLQQLMDPKSVTLKIEHKSANPYLGKTP
jgi:hypothetical protein